MSHSGITLILIMTIAVLAPLLAYLAGRWLPVPLVIFEILLGIVVGPDVLDWARSDALIDGLSQLGLTMLIFLAGYEIEFGKIRGDTLNRSVRAWLIALVLGLGTGVLLAGGWTKGVFVGVALTSTALGTVLPVLRDEGDLHGRCRARPWCSTGRVVSSFCCSPTTTPTSCPGSRPSTGRPTRSRPGTPSTARPRPPPADRAGQALTGRPSWRAMAFCIALRARGVSRAS